MKNKPEFKPVITRVELNPEQAVLSCSCYNTGRITLSARDEWAATACKALVAKDTRWAAITGSSSSSS